MPSSRHRSGGSPSGNPPPTAPRRPSGPRRLPQAQAELDRRDDYDDTEALAPRDPVRAIVGLLLVRASSAVGTSAEEAGRDGVVCVVVVPSSDWTEPVQDEWRDRFRGGHHALDGRYDYSGERGTWIAWSPTERPRPQEARGAAAAFAHAVSLGRHCVGFAADPSWLPPDLLDAADLRLTLPSPTAADVAELAFVLTGRRPGTTLSDVEAAALTPRLLRLARRPGQEPDAYVAKLRDLLERDRAAATVAAATSVREGPTLDRLHGLDEAIAWGRNVIRDLEEFRTGRIAWADLDRGCLLSGPPGCGKSMFARALAATGDVPLVVGSYGEWHGSGGAHQGDLLKAMRRTFETARSKVPCILFIDEVDSFPNRSTIRHNYVEWETQVVNALLAELDGVQGREGVVVLGACNHPDRLDPALVRSGRLDRHIRIGLPGRRDLERILREHLGPDLQGEPLSGAALAAMGSSGADCEKFVRGARRRQRRAGRAMVPSDLMAEILGNDGRNADDLRLCAVHEAGHALAYCLSRPGTVVSTSLARRGEAEGTTVTAGLGTTFSAEEGRLHLTAILAGRAAEAMTFGHASSGSGGGASSDLGRATTLAAMLVASFGFDPSHGLLWAGLPDPSTLPGFLSSDPALAARLRFLLDAAYDDALRLLRSRRDALHALADALLERRVLDGEEVAAIVATYPPTGGTVR